MNIGRWLPGGAKPARQQGAEDSLIVRNYRTAAEVIGWITLLGGISVLVVGWWLGVEPVRRPIPNTAPMKPNTALALIFVGLSLVSYLRGWARFLSVASAGVVILDGAVVLAEYATGAATTSFDSLLGTDPSAVLVQNPDRMALITASCLVLLGIALILLVRGRVAGLRQALGIVVATIGSAAFFGYLLDDADLASWGTAFAPIATETTALMMLLGVAVILAAPDVGWARVIASPLLGGQSFRIGFLPVLAITVAVGAVTDSLHSYFEGGHQPLGVAIAQGALVAMAALLVALLFVASTRIDHVDRRRNALAANVAASERQYRLLAENASDLVWQIDPDGHLTWVSESVTAELGWRREQVLDRFFVNLVHSENRGHARAALGAVFAGKTVAGEYRTLCADGSYRPMEIIIHPATTDSGNFGVATLRNVQNEIDSRETLAHAIEHDPLTGLATRSVFVSRVDGILGGLDRGRKAGVLCAGIDSLESINEALTHAGGDRVITTIAARINAIAEHSDLLARGSGDEFLILVPDLISGADAGILAEKVRLAARGTMSIGPHQIHPTVSIGIATGGRDTDADDLLRDAALAMRKAKDNGRDRCEFAQSQLAQEAQERLNIEDGIREGLRVGQFVPWFQPIANLEGAGVVGYEALVRWVRPDGIIVAPDDFLPIAERTTLITDLDLAVLEQTIEMLARLPPPMHIAANLSAATMINPQLAERVTDALSRSGVDPARLHLEFTETALLRVTDRVGDMMRDLADTGIKWYVDDFGTGYSSIAHLRDLPIAGLKLDLSFTRGLGGSDPTSERLAKALAGMADGLGLDTVAEGVETSEQATILRAQGWRHGQGWLYGHAEPLPRIGLPGHSGS